MAVADLDLLFGLIALQNGLIVQDQLLGAFRAWTLDKGRALADHLTDRGDLDAEQRAGVEAMVALHLRKHGDDIERSLAAIPAGRSTRESLARMGTPEVDASLARVGSRSTQHNTDRTASYSVGTATSDGQRFRVLRPHAQGGLGAVFVALDAELHREVALKQILDRHADDPASRQRFLLEAEITGGLEHPGVVPVYGLGTYGDGRPYYAMRFIQGDSLKQAIERFHADERLQKDAGGRALELRKLLRRFLDVCNAIAYAHSRGVLHRDIKPGNVIVGKYGETLVVDWGLAKAAGRADPGSAPDERTLVPSSSSSRAETLPGSALGTPSYMSPEQARGELDRLGPRSDVYSLGATLYCLLTGEPPFLGDDLGMILRRVQQDEFPPPRTLDSAIDPALEAVCLKAMARKPENRYTSPRGLAEDIERWMADEPVAAWPEPWARRMRRWARRNRAMVMTATVAMVVALVGTAAVLAVQTRANRQLNQANLALKASNNALATANTQVMQTNADLTAANDRVAARFDLALEAVKLFHGEVSDDLLFKEKQFDALRTRLLRGAAEFYRKLEGLLKPQVDRPSRAALGRAYEALGEVTDKIGSKREALAIHRQALVVRRALAAEPGADATITSDVARSLLDIGSLLYATGKPAEALEAYGEAQAINAVLARANPDVTDFRVNLAADYNNSGIVLLRTGKPGEALVAYEAARAIQQRLADANPTVTQFQSDLALSHNNIGQLLRDTGKPAEAMASYQAAVAIQQRLAEASPAVIQFQFELASSHNNIGVLLANTGKPGEALASYQAALAIQQRLAKASPAVTAFQLGLAMSHNNIGNLLRETGKPGEALTSHQAALAIEQRLVDANPTVTQFQLRLAGSHANIGILSKEEGKLGEGLASFEAARAILQTLIDSNPNTTRFQIELANAHLETGDVLRLTGQPAKARTSYEEALAIIERLIKAQPTLAQPLQVFMVFGLKGLGATQQTADAVASWRRAVASGERTRSSYSETLYYLAGCHAQLGGIAGTERSGVSAGEGAAELDRAMGVLRRAVTAGYRNSAWMRRDPDLDPLRARPDFQVLMMDLTFPSEPFSKNADADR